VIHLLIIIGIICAALTAVRARDLLAAAVCLAISSALLAILFFDLGAGTAAIFELSVGAGLVSVLFITAISLVKAAREDGSDEE